MLRVPASVVTPSDRVTFVTASRLFFDMSEGSGGWFAHLETELALSQEESTLQEEADACRSSSVEGDDVPVPMTPQTSDSWFVQNIKAATRALHPGGNRMLEHPVNLVSNCTGAFSEGVAMQAASFFQCFFWVVFLLPICQTWF